MTGAATRPLPTHYQVLNVTRVDKRSALSSQTLKAAYHRALLLNHPDKAKTPPPRPNVTGNGQHYSVDQIAAAYRILSDPTTCAEYDRSLETEEADGRKEGIAKTAHTGLETFDLEDLTQDDVSDVWYRGCRCGDEQGYLITQQDLERESLHEEIFVGCKGCSLWIRVLFISADNDDDLDSMHSLPQGS